MLSFSRCRALLAGLVIAATLTAPRLAGAQSQGEETTPDGLSVRVNAEWVGGGDGGYLPIRIQVINSLESRELRFRLEPTTNKEKIPIVKKTVRADQNSMLVFTLRVPLVGSGTSAALKVFDENGDEIESLFQRIVLPARNQENSYSPAVLVISDTPPNTKRLETAVHSLSTMQLGHPPHHRMGSIPGQSNGLKIGNVPRVLVPDSWIDFTAVDIVVARLSEFEKLSQAQRTAILKWVQCGGTLLVQDVGETPENSKPLNRVLQFQEQDARKLTWRPADIESLVAVKNIKIFTATQQQQVIRPGDLLPPVVRNPERARPIEIVQPKASPITWLQSGRAFAWRNEKLGTIVAFRGDPFEGSARDWMWLLKSLSSERYHWAERHGISARRDSGEFLNFLIPGVKGVPVYAFLFLMTVFTLIIGPLNYLLLWRRKQLFLLVLTIPIIAFVTSLSLFGYSAVSHGFSVKSRVRSLTLIDQRDQTAVTTSRVAYFAGLAPTEGLQFAEDTAVYPIWPHSNDFEAGVVEWGDSQSLQSGWLRSRTRTQFLTTRHYRERGRLEFHFKNSDSPEVVNGFDFEIGSLLVADEKGHVYYAEGVAAGKSAQLKSADGKAYLAFAQRITQNKLLPPENIDEYRDSSIFNVRRRAMRHGPFRSRRRNRKVPYSSSLMERRIAEMAELSTGKFQLPPNTYVTFLSNNPRIGAGLADSEEVQGFHLLIGNF